MPNDRTRWKKAHGLIDTWAVDPVSEGISEELSRRFDNGLQGFRSGPTLKVTQVEAARLLGLPNRDGRSHGNGGR
jgi:hypothetical protein